MLKFNDCIIIIDPPVISPSVTRLQQNSKNVRSTFIGVDDFSFSRNHVRYNREQVPLFEPISIDSGPEELSNSTNRLMYLTYRCMPETIYLFTTLMHQSLTTSFSLGLTSLDTSCRIHLNNSFVKRVDFVSDPEDKTKNNLRIGIAVGNTTIVFGDFINR